jgi:glycosyltransferase involved in cell wall biosynthesis
MSKKENLIFFNPSIEGGGVEKNLFALANDLAKKKFKVFFCTYYKKIENKKFIKIYKFNKNIKIVYPFLNVLKKSRVYKIITCFIKIIFFNFKKKKIIVSFQANIFGIIAAKITGSKIIIRCNTSPDKYIKNFISKKIFYYFYSKADGIIVPSKSFKEKFLKFFNLDCYIHKQILNKEEITRKSKEKIVFNFFNNKKILKLISVGRLVDQKDQMTLLKSVKKVIKYRPVKLLLIGSGRNEEKIRKFISYNNLTNCIKLINFTPNPFPYIKLSDVFILTSKYEGNPNILLETAILKKLIISTDCNTGPREILQNGKNGFLVKVGDYNNIFRILLKLNLKNKSIISKIKSSYLYVCKNFKKNNTKEFINILRKVSK